VRRCLVSVFAVIALVAGLTAEQVRDVTSQANGTGRLGGRVVAKDTGRPIRGAQIFISNSENGVANQGLATGDDGRWEVRDLPAGRYTARAAKTGFVAWWYGQSQASLPPTSIELAAGAAITNIDITLPPTGVITGRIVDQFGEPISNVSVSALTYRFTDGERRLVNAPTEGFGTTDDRGEYRLYGLVGGNYYIRASGAGIAAATPTRRVRYVPVYYPGTVIEAEAQRVTLGEGQQVVDISFGIIPVPVASVSGVVRDESGQPAAGGQVLLSPSGRSTGAFGSSGPIRAGGEFVITFVAPGDYVLQYGRGGGGGRGVPSAAPGPSPFPPGNLVSQPVPLTVAGQDISNVLVTLSQGTTVSGRLVFETPPPRNLTAAAFVVTASPGARNSVPNARGEWVLTGLAGRQLIRVQATSGSMPPDVMLKAVRLNGRDVTDEGLDLSSRQDATNIEIVMTSRLTSVSGTVRSADAKPVVDYDVVVFSPEPSRWGSRTRYIARAHADREGRFLIRGLPPEDYLVVAVPFLEAGDEFDPDVLARLRRSAAPVRLAENDAKTVIVALARWPG